jgi:hypothetical protein
MWQILISRTKFNCAQAQKVHLLTYRIRMLTIHKGLWSMLFLDFLLQLGMACTKNQPKTCHVLMEAFDEENDNITK